MRNSSRTLRTINSRREFPAAVPYTESGVTAVVPQWDWQSEFPRDEAPTRIDVTYDYRDQESWTVAPRRSTVRSLSPMHAPESAPPSTMAQRAAKALFARLPAMIRRLGCALASVFARGSGPSRSAPAEKSCR